jgi:hypothetical protein
MRWVSPFCRVPESFSNLLFLPNKNADSWLESFSNLLFPPNKMLTYGWNRSQITFPANKNADLWLESFSNLLFLPNKNADSWLDSFLSSLSLRKNSSINGEPTPGEKSTEDWCILGQTLKLSTRKSLIMSKLAVGIVLFLFF